MDEYDQERAVNMLLVELRLLNSRANWLTFFAGLWISSFVGGFVYGLGIGLDIEAGRAAAFGVGAAFLALIAFVLLVPTRSGIEAAMEKGE
jgi:hypothetical protein